MSRALRNSPVVTPATRARIQEIARAYHYMPNEIARFLMLISSIEDGADGVDRAPLGRELPDRIATGYRYYDWPRRVKCEPDTCSCAGSLTKRRQRI